MNTPIPACRLHVGDSSARKRVVINADDVGMNDAVDRAAVLLAASGRISAASVMTLGTPATGAVDELTQMNICLGLHLDFTSPMFNTRYNSRYSVRSLITDTWTRRLDSSVIKTIITEQLDRFEELTDSFPVFIDGHQHVHQFPIIRDSLIQILRSRYPGRRFYLRNTVPTTWRGWKAQFIGGLGGHALRRRADEDGHKYNVDFCGVYDFSLRDRCYNRWHRWLTSLPMLSGLVMCHPGMKSRHAYDAIAEARVIEFDFLRSAQFADLLDELKVDVVGWGKISGRQSSESGF